MDVAVIGAGLAGLTAAHTLVRAGHRVDVFEKSRGVGGRMSVRRAGPFAFDHGAQYFTARDPRFVAQVDSWRAREIVKVWRGTFVEFEEGEARPLPGTEEERLVGVPGMNALAKDLAAGLEVEVDCRIAALEVAEGRWIVRDSEGGQAAICDAVVLAMPPVQADALLSTSGLREARLAEIELESCWAVLLGFEDRQEPRFDAARIDDPALAWAARNNSKPRRGSAESWVLHATPQWSKDHLPASREDTIRERVITDLRAAFERSSGHTLGPASFSTAHFWRFARVTRPLGEDALFEESPPRVVCGDGCRGARVEEAFLSGLAAAEKLEAWWGRARAQRP